MSINDIYNFPYSVSARKLWGGNINRHMMLNQNLKCMMLILHIYNCLLRWQPSWLVQGAKLTALHLFPNCPLPWPYPEPGLYPRSFFSPANTDATAGLRGLEWETENQLPRCCQLPAKQGGKHVHWERWAGLQGSILMWRLASVIKYSP